MARKGKSMYIYAMFINISPRAFAYEIISSFYSSNLEFTTARHHSVGLSIVAANLTRIAQRHALVSLNSFIIAKGMQVLWCIVKNGA